MNIKKSDFSLNDFVDPNRLNNNLNVDGYEFDTLYNLLNSMLRIRIAEYKLAEGRKNGLIGGPVHLGVGQEAIAVGISSYLTSKDMVFGAHRSHAHLLALNSSVYKLFAEVLGKATGHSKGMGGSMHLWDESVGFYGSVPIVSGTVSLAVGAALASKLKSLRSVSVAYFGDGAIEEGVVHESLNFAKVHNIPIIFIVENNLFASHMHISKRQPSYSTARFAYANNIDYEIVDGNDILKLRSIANRFIDNSRKGMGPYFLEAITYRWFGHVDWRDDIDVGVCRSKADLDSWKLRDPVRRLSNGMCDAGFWNETKHKDLINEIESEINEAWDKAINDPLPSDDSILKFVYSSN